jgi:hypothetical protein
MKFYEVLTQVIGRLVCEQRVSYRVLQQEFALDDEGLEIIAATAKQVPSP